MKIENAWNWDNVESEFWIKPSEDVYYYLHRWLEKEYKNFLDLGCGPGRHSILFAENKFNVTGIDLSKSGIKKAIEQNNIKNLHIKYLVANATSLPFKNSEFDCILAYHSIYHLKSDDFKSAISELNRVLKKKGEVYLTLLSKEAVSFKNCIKEKIIDNNVRLKEEEDGSVLPHFYVDYDDIKSIFENEFEIIKVRHIQDFYENKNGWHYFIHLSK